MDGARREWDEMVATAVRVRPYYADAQMAVYQAALVHRVSLTEAQHKQMAQEVDART